MGFPSMDKILIVEDDRITRFALCGILQKEGFSIIENSNGTDAVEIFKSEMPSTVLLDLKMPGRDGIEILTEIKKIDSSIPVIVITGLSDVATVVNTMKLGAYDFLVKPVESNKLIVTVKRAIEKLRLEREINRLHVSVDTSMEWMLGKSPPIKRIIDEINNVAISDFSIIIQGETGSGKTFIANIIHNLSRRAKGPFVKVDLGAIPETLIESELFGYEKGAFTGAVISKEGFFKVANSGTILIDELENLSPLVQSKLLSSIENRVVYPLGSKKPLPINVRIIAATNHDIKRSVLEKKFRDDLFFRLGEFIITIPPIRERIEDIPFFAHKFLGEACSELNKKVNNLSEEILNLLMRYPWPGNVRELKNVIRRSVLISRDGEIRPEHIKFLIEEKAESGDNLLLPLKDAVCNVEKMMINKALEVSNGNRTKAADILQIDIKTLRSKIREYHIE